MGKTYAATRFTYEADNDDSALDILCKIQKAHPTLGGCQTPPPEDGVYTAIFAGTVEGSDFHFNRGEMDLIEDEIKYLGLEEFKEFLSSGDNVAKGYDRFDRVGLAEVKGVMKALHPLYVGKV